MPQSINQSMKSLLSKRKDNSALRALTTTSSNAVDFSSNDFLSLSNCPIFKKAYLTELTTSPDFHLGSGGSRLLDGNSRYAENLEAEIAAFHGAPAALLFNSGFDANAGFFACVPQPGDVVLYDEFIHASVHEGMRLSRAGSCKSFSHNSLRDLRERIEELREDEKAMRGERNVFVAVESLYSMDGDLAHLEAIVDLVDELLPKGNGLVVVDEAHSNGVYGEHGRGIVCSLGLEKRVFARLHTFGKGLACNGAAILCSPLTREYLINYARPLIYSTSMSFPSLAAIKVVYSLKRQGMTQPLINHLNELIEHMYRQLLSLLPHAKDQLTGVQILQIPNELPRSPIIALLTPEPRSLAKYCQEKGFVVRAIVPPTVPEGTQRVRDAKMARDEAWD
ncbi:related to 7-keto-8-aminopelargonate synthetase and related enzymes [Rhynchosporium graminicola]|uniref:Related to 7-keto-8-aminopelargonate synthetase and related enzymes n=1 Tax=Rhynchosporium graminicola TaxID=2792576 RepID=A0A1E1L8Y7_9HELO|nr:related to 7-keto-8-aminopelargonate synthetase and related enzymes [Rhynchosporium commune]